MVTTREVQLIQESAEAFARAAAQLREQNQRLSAQKLNAGGHEAKYKVGDAVTFYIPPTASQAERRGRKAKHLSWYRGPAKIVRVLSGTTYQLEHQGTLYNRATSELRPYRGRAGRAKNNSNKGSERQPATPGAHDNRTEQPQKYTVGTYLAYRTNSGDRRYHVGLVVATLEQELQVHTHATVNNKAATAVWKPMYHTRRGEYTTQRPRGRTEAARDNKLYDRVPNQPEDQLALTPVTLTSQNKLARADLRILRTMNLQHHVLGDTWP